MSITISGLLGFCLLLSGRLQSARAEVPQPVSPPDGVEVTDVALSFYCTKDDGIKSVEYQAGRSPDLSSPSRTGHVEQVWLPETTFQPGTWYWHVRGVTDSGEHTAWSDIRSFTVNSERSRTSPDYRPSPASPLYLFEAWKPEQWAHVPEDLKPYVAFKLRPIFYDYRLRRKTDEWNEKIRRYEEKGIPLFLLGHEDQYPSAELEKLYRNFDSVKGVVLRELMWWHSWHGFRGNGGVKDIITRHLKLAEKYGKQVIWTDGHWRHLLFLETGVDRAFLEQVISTHSDYFIPAAKLNFAYHPTVIQSLLQGFWLRDEIQFWGHQPESWYHHGGGPGSDWRGPRASCPPMFYPMMVLSGVRAGATLYSFEPPGDIWAGRGGLEADKNANRSEGFSRTWEDIMIPLLRELVEHQLIPAKETVRKKSPVALQYDQSIFATEDGTPGSYWKAEKSGPTYRPAWRRLNGPLSVAQRWRHEAEVIPNESRYEFLPYVPDYGSKNNSFSTVLSLEKANQFAGEKTPAGNKLIDKLNPHYAPVPWEGTAYIQKIESVYFVINNREERVVDRQTFDVPFPSGPIQNVKGDLGRHAFLILQKQDKEDRIYAQARRADNAGGPHEGVRGHRRIHKLQQQADHLSLTITVSSPEKQVKVKPKTRIDERKQAGNRVSLTLSFQEGPAVITVE